MNQPNFIPEAIATICMDGRTGITATCEEISAMLTERDCLELLDIPNRDDADKRPSAEWTNKTNGQLLDMCAIHALYTRYPEAYARIDEERRVYYAENQLGNGE